MSEYLTKEEIRKWRSSLERITLEEYAKRLGKVISEEKETNDMVDIALKSSHFVEESPISAYQVKVERISSLAQQSFEREREIENIKDSREILKPVSKSVKEEKVEKTIRKEAEKTAAKAKSAAAPAAVKKSAPAPVLSSSEDIQLTFKKNLTPREQAVFEHFLNNKNNIVFAKELAEVLELPRDYVYKYIKNLRAKLNENAIHNADNGGFVLRV